MDRKQVFEIVLNNVKVKSYSEELKIKAESIIQMWGSDPDGFGVFVRELKDAVRAREIFFSEVDEVYEAITKAPEKRSKDGQVEMGQSGPVTTPWKMSEIRKNVYIQRLIDEELARLEAEGLDEDDIDEIMIELPPSYAYHLGTMMVERMKFSDVSGQHVIDLHDKMVDIEADAQKIVKKDKDSDSDNDNE